MCFCYKDREAHYPQGERMSVLPEVEVLLATYNGARFLREQLDSIFAQDYPNIRVLARDDGSTDGTVEILNQYEKRFPGQLRVMPASGASGSPKNNFLLLMKASSAAYVCFSDQDDVWLPDKVSRTKQAMDQLESQWGTELPLLVFTDLHLVDDKLTILHKSFWNYMSIRPRRIERLSGVIIQSVVTGCTVMCNRQLIQFAVRMREEAYIHDWWMSWLASSMGKSGIVETPTVLYRQHDRNVIGTGGNVFGVAVRAPRRSWWERIRQPRIAPGYLMQWEYSQRQARAFLEEHGAELSDKNRALLKAFLQCQTSRSRFTRIATFIRHGFYYIGVKPNLAMVIHLWRMNADGC
jgi:glycosyltransferase involved in cell wall biosynthesis